MSADRREPYVNDLSLSLLHFLVISECCLVGFKDKESEEDTEGKDRKENVLPIHQQCFKK